MRRSPVQAYLRLKSLLAKPALQKSLLFRILGKVMSQRIQQQMSEQVQRSAVEAFHLMQEYQSVQIARLQETASLKARFWGSLLSGHTRLDDYWTATFPIASRLLALRALFLKVQERLHQVPLLRNNVVNLKIMGIYYALVMNSP